jgi:hypothetical protein
MFECLCVYVQCHRLSTTIVVDHRPNSIAVSYSFIEECVDVLEQDAVSSSELPINGVVNIHLDDVNDPLIVKIQKLVSGQSLVQRVQTVTHNSGHRLGIIITRVDPPFSGLRLDPPSLSDHSPNIVELDRVAVDGVEES